MAKHTRTSRAEPVIFPYSQRSAFGRGAFSPKAVLSVSCSGDMTASACCDEVGRIVGVDAVEAQRDKADVLCCVGATAKSWWRERGLKAPSACFKPEGYALEVTRRQVVIAAADPCGFFYALQTLAQAGGDGRAMPCMSVRDWPRFPMRGVHVYMPARRDLAFFKRYIEFLARYKFNTMFLEVGAGMEYDTHPEINAGWERLAAEAASYEASQSRMQNSAPGHKDSIHIELGGGSYLTKDEVRDILACCAANHVEVVPEVQSLSHSYYLLASHRELAENPKERWPDTYCPSNPKTYELLFDLMQEAIDVFHPRTMSIGHDEVYTIGFCPRCRNKDKGKLLAADINRIHAFLAERGIRTAMWSEKLHHNPGPCRETWRHKRFGEEFRGATPNTTGAFKLVPKDILLMNWYNGVDPQILRMLRENGFDQVLGNYGAFFYLENVRQKNGCSLDELLKKDRRGRPVKPGQGAQMLGAEVSTWCAPIPENLAPHLFLSNQVTLWSRELTPNLLERMNADLLPILRREAHILAGETSLLASGEALKFRPVSLAPVADIICDGHGRMWGGFGNMDLRNMPAGKVTLAGVPFEVLDYPRTRQCPFVGVDGNVRDSFPVPVRMQARGLVFLHTSCVRVRSLAPWTSLHLGPPVIGAYRIAYSNGETVELPIEHDRNIAGVHNVYGRPPRLGDLAWQGKDAAGRPIALYTFEWVNPRPETPIDSVTMVWKGGYLEGDIVLAGLTAIR